MNTFKEIKEKLNIVLNALNTVQVSGYNNLKNLGISMEIINEIVKIPYIAAEIAPEDDTKEK